MNSFRQIYFIQCHQSPEKLKDLIRHVYDPECLYIIHRDAKSPRQLADVEFSLCGLCSNIVSLPSIYVSWGGYSQVEILVNAIRYALENAEGWSHFIVLSEDHLPVRSGKDIDAYLSTGVSYVQSTKYTNMPPVEQKDIEHRFSAVFREVTAWGMFPVAELEARPWIQDFIYQGSNWVILVRDHCSLLMDTISRESEMVSRLQQCIQPDEMFVQTLLAAANVPGGVVRNQLTTYVAWPSVSGNNDMTFTAQNFFDAQNLGFLFIRKAPRVIPGEVQQCLNELAYWTKRELDELLSYNVGTYDTANDPSSTPDELARDIYFKMTERGVQVANIANRSVKFRPSLYLQFRLQGLSDRTFAALISEDMKQFKLLICFSGGEYSDFETALVGHFKAHVLRVRVWSLMLSREVCVEWDRSRGFGRFSDFESIDALCDYIESYVVTSARFDKLLNTGNPANGNSEEGVPAHTDEGTTARLEMSKRARRRTRPAPTAPSQRVASGSGRMNDAGEQARAPKRVKEAAVAAPPPSRSILSVLHGRLTGSDLRAAQAQVADLEAQLARAKIMLKDLRKSVRKHERRHGKAGETKLGVS